MDEYHIFQTEPLKRFRFAQFPYMIYQGEYPHGRVIDVADTLWGARRILRRHLRRTDTGKEPVGPVYGMKEVERV